MHSTLEQLNLIKNKVNDIINKKQLKTNPNIIVVTKTFPLDKIKSLLEMATFTMVKIKFRKQKINGLILEIIINTYSST